MTEPTAEQAKKLETIQRLFKQAEHKNTPPAEAQAFRERAEELLAKYAIDETMLAAARGEEHEGFNINTEIYTFRTQFADGLIRWCGVIAEPLGCRALMVVGGTASNRQCVIIGWPPDIKRVMDLFDSLQLQMANPLHTFTDEVVKPIGMTEYRQFQARRDFVVGFGAGAGKRLKDLMDNLRATTPGAELVLVGKELAVNAVAEERSSGKARGHKPGAGGYRHGVREGYEANVGGTGINA